MHQHPRVPPVTASPARALQTNPVRSNNPRDQPTHSRHGSESTTPGEQGIYMTEAGQPSSNASRETSPEGKLDLIVQNYFYKAALMILDARTSLPQAYTSRDNKPRVNRWFNTELPETDELLNSTRQWKNATALRNRPQPMIVETYIDLRDLASNQKLVITDEKGRRQDVEVALKEQVGGNVTNDSQLRECSIILERWTCELGSPWPELDESFPLNDVLPKVYKGSIVLYRSLFAHLKFMPAWKLYKKAIKPHPGQLMPRLRWRIYESTQKRHRAGVDELEMPLCVDEKKVTETIRWDPVDSPAGQFSIRATYRVNCDFRVDTSESLFNSQFMASDEQWFQPSLPRSPVLENQRAGDNAKPAEIPPAPGVRQDTARRKLDELAEKGPAYGSMSTFHNMTGKVGTSPLSALRAARELHAKSPADSPPRMQAPSRPMSRSNSRRSNDATTPEPRRLSISIQPFKTPAFSSSVPAEHVAPPPSPRTGSVNRNSPLAALTEARYPSSSSQAPTSPKTSPSLADVLPLGSATGSPRPTPSRFSSSFSHRKNRPSVGATSNKTDDDQISSGRGSTSSSNVQTGPTAEGANSNSLQTDDDNISEFLKMLDLKKELKSFRNPQSAAAGTSTTRGTTAALHKFQQLRDSHAALSDSLSSSQMLQRSSVSSASRQLGNVPPMVAGTSTSIASSPGERISPRTPHTPAIPSRLSSNSIIEYNQAERGQRPRLLRYSEGDDASISNTESIDRQRVAASSQDDPSQIAGAIPIPTSPRAYQTSYRRSSSATAQQHNRRTETYDVADDLGDILPFALRSASLGDGDEREPLSLSGLMRLQENNLAIPTGIHPPPSDVDHQVLVRMDRLQSHTQTTLQDVAGNVRSGSDVGSTDHAESQRASGRGQRTLVRHSFSRPAGLTNFEDDEPLLFAMSEQLEATATSDMAVDSSSGVSTGGAGMRNGRLQQW